MTLNRMPENVKIELVNAMAHPPAEWPAWITMSKTETKISTARHDFAKNPNKKNKVHTLTPRRDAFLSYQMITVMHISFAFVLSARVECGLHSTKRSFCCRVGNSPTHISASVARNAK
jgi:hypothetical protein